MKKLLSIAVLGFGSLCAINALAEDISPVEPTTPPGNLGVLKSVTEVVVEGSGTENCYTTTYSNGDKVTECIGTKNPVKEDNKPVKIVRLKVKEKICFKLTFKDGTVVVDCVR